MRYNLANNISNDSIGHKVIERRPACHLSGEITTFCVIKRVTLRPWWEVPLGSRRQRASAVLFEVRGGWLGKRRRGVELLCGFNSLAQLLKIAQADVS